MSRQRRPAAEWRSIVGDQQRSGLSVAEFCRGARVRPVTFYAWRRRLCDQRGFVEVKIADEVMASELPTAPPVIAALELRLPGKCSVFIPPGFDPQSLRALLAVLEDGGPASDGAEAWP